MANVKHGRSEKFEDGTKLKMQTEITPPFLQGQFFGTNLKLIFRRGKIFSCRRNDIFGRYFGMILLYFRTKICLMIGKQTSYWSKTGFFLRLPVKKSKK